MFTGVCWKIQQRNEQTARADDVFMKQESSRGFEAQMKQSDNLAYKTENGNTKLCTKNDEKDDK